MKVTIYGSGYVGLVTGSLLADVGNDVLCVDVDEAKVANLKKGIIPIFEPGLDDVIKRNVAAQRLDFITDIISKEVTKSNVTQILNMFTSEVVEKKITKDVSPIYPLKNVKIRKIKVIQRPNIDYNKLNEMHDPNGRILTKATEKVQGRKGKQTRSANVEGENLVNKE